jgi:hypothetical protein
LPLHSASLLTVFGRENTKRKKSKSLIKNGLLSSDNEKYSLTSLQIQTPWQFTLGDRFRKVLTCLCGPDE